MTMTFKLDRKGAQEVLKNLAADGIDAVAQQVADLAGAGAVFHTYTTDRAAASVGVPAARQAKSGALTRAAAEAGLEVRLRKS
ncbi:hypothetical protein SEA_IDENTITYCRISIS_11 [Mycobacterium phage IdentityCrisis]|uniref:Uncharacterized protein n=1 Tax=Mycobacterium phage IdentityCrisis TaxID=2599866 RepID=A0A5J6TGL7_9CAUD|nr:hypothetical protein QEH37_gp11 [Mycobacterium phage IdentityCrisis]QFG10031.1 hypothetical protein SEA_IDENTITYCRISIS_11 [Mycobacterium phage IdentityCrisis]